MTAVAKLPTVDELAQEIRRVDGNHSLGAGALAEALMPFLAALSPAELGGVEAVPLVQSSAPERIWLAVADDAYYADQPFPNGLEEVCWSSDAPLEVCVPYVRADLSTPRAAEAVAWAGVSPLGTHCVSVSKEAIEIQCYGRGWVVTPLYAFGTRTIEAASVDREL